MKKILIAGGSGFIGTALQQHLKSQGYHVFVLTRSPKNDTDVEWDGESLGPWTAQLEGAFALINLAGKSINCRHTPENKDAILQSRVVTTRLLGEAVMGCTHPPQTWMNASAGGIYPADSPVALTEDSTTYGTDFVAEVAKTWEEVFRESETPNTRKIALRTTLVFGDDGGAFPVLKKISQFGLGGKQGDGKQKVSWIHRHDFVRAIEFLLAHPELNGPINLSTPEISTNQQMMASLREAVGMSIGIPTPAFLMKLGAAIIGTPPSLVLNGMNVFPSRLTQANFTYEFPTLASAFSDLVD